MLNRIEHEFCSSIQLPKILHYCQSRSPIDIWAAVSEVPENLILTFQSNSFQSSLWLLRHMFSKASSSAIQLQVLLSFHMCYQSDMSNISFLQIWCTCFVVAGCIMHVLWCSIEFVAIYLDWGSDFQCVSDPYFYYFNFFLQVCWLMLSFLIKM